MKKSIYAVLAAVIFMLISFNASAATMDVTYGDLQTVRFDYVSPYTGNTKTSGYAAEFHITLNDGVNWDDFFTIAYCVDIDNTIKEQSYDVTLNPVTLDSSNYLHAAWLMDTWSADASGDALKAAGLQLAIWDAIYGDNFTNTTTGTIGGYYDFYYSSALSLSSDAMWSSLGYNYTVTTYSTGINAQSLLVQLDPVPEPGTMLLLGMGIAGLSAAGRKRLKRNKC